ncbi:hypothetical protein [Acidithiobacillus caldus]|jgi:hypothetical protein|uniref:hypothetical protein n=1 Tax=Acidithiobacillus caldus TaxID=33059 RepID=UPI00056EA9C6|nr:hypothetical protein [Acidithiobacillus caldus]MBU2729607.1 hypothetical protein [Acidithiobacillus caldus]MBU2734252.1 hypothetical protein [Acidithiobacillus caldus ATCC 51756]MBU2746098.1 hypothetical protein [Acidithiobacillus caldus]MBU2764098.1 hypothetical protein [Acidithiobacillus caldus]MBU2772103.1 hypothetical protein [Acidithiobacillus caldus]
MTSDPRAKKIMVPWEIQASAVFNAVMGVFPLLEMKPAETEHLLRWVARRDRATLRAVRAKETRQRIPEGPGGYWSRWYQRSGKAYRPHRLDEVFVEWMSSVWIEENEPGYLMVISSGPFGGLCAVFWNDSLISEEEYMPFQTLEEAKTWVKRRLENRQGKSLGKA